MKIPCAVCRIRVTGSSVRGGERSQDESALRPALVVRGVPRQERAGVGIKHCSILDEVSELLLNGKRGVEDRVRYSNSVDCLTPLDHMEAGLSLSLKPGMKTEHIICKTD